MFQRARTFFETYDLLLCPTTIVPPFPVEQRYVTECNGTKFETYVDWLLIVSAITLVACWRVLKCWKIFWDLAP